MVYRARPGQAKGGTRRYLLLAEMLLSQLAAGPEPTKVARHAGRAWGAHLVNRPAPGPSSTGFEESVERLVAMLSELDFAPEPVTNQPEAYQHGAPDREMAGQHGAPDQIRLRHCPFLDLAEPHRELVCTLHLGLMQGALTELDAPVTVSDLVPFAEPAACLAHLTPTSNRPQSQTPTQKGVRS
jgi:predicted ArsR family transcriptional regulator